MPPVDAAPVAMILSQNISTVSNGTRLACRQDNTLYTAENSYYRVFTLADHGITGSYEVRAVTFAVNLADANGATQPGRVRIGRYTGTPGGDTLAVANIVVITEVNIQIPNGAISVTTPISGVLPPGSHLIAELFIPRGVEAQHRFFVGTNAAGEAKPAYMRAPTCGTPDPKRMNLVGQENGVAKTDLIMTVDGVKY
jgi:hypothetical protein